MSDEVNLMERLVAATFAIKFPCDSTTPFKKRSHENGGPCPRNVFTEKVIKNNKPWVFLSCHLYNRWLQYLQVLEGQMVWDYSCPKLT